MNGCDSNALIKLSETLIILGTFDLYYAAANRYYLQLRISYSQYSGANVIRMPQKYPLSTLELPFHSFGM